MAYSLESKIKQLEEIEAYFQKPDMDLEVAVTKHKEALKIAKEILGYLQKTETTINEIDMTILKDKNPEDID